MEHLAAKKEKKLILAEIFTNEENKTFKCDIPGVFYEYEIMYN